MGLLVVFIPEVEIETHKKKNKKLSPTKLSG